MTLRELRINRGVSESELAARVSEITGVSRGPRAVVMWEFRGVEDLRIIKAIGKALEYSEDEVSAAAAQSALGVGPKLQRGRPRKNISSVA